MQGKLIFTAVGTFSFGALLSWAVTTDILENRFKAERAGYDQLLADKTEHIWALQDRLEARNEVGQSSFEVDSNQMNLLEVAVPTLTGLASGFTVTIDDDKVNVFTPEPEEDISETPEETRTNLEKLIAAYTADQDAQDSFVESAARSLDSDTATPPFVISREDYSFDEEGEYFNKITLTYYPRDRVLLDDEEDPIEDIASLVGWRNLSQFGGESGDPDVVFVRNRRLSTDFEVVKDEDSPLPLHVKYGMEKEEFHVNRAAGLIKLRQEDDDN